jgi:FkbM family methyltransferase
MLIPFANIYSKYNMKINGILHIGAHNLEEYNDYNKIVQGERMIWIDAISEKVTNGKIQFPNTNILFGVVSDKDNELVNFKITNNGQSSSILDFGTHSQNYPDIVFIEQRKVFTTRVDTLIDQHNLSIPFNFLNMDIQGAELLALKGMGKYLKQLDYIYTEVNTNEVYKNCAQLGELDDFLEKNGFQRVEIVMTDAAWGDALYVRTTLLKPRENGFKIFFEKNGRLGNNLVQYSVAKLFPKHTIVSSLQELDKYITVDDKTFSEWDEILIINQDIYLQGFFQWGPLLTKYRDQIKQIYNTSNTDLINNKYCVSDICNGDFFKIAKEDILLHLRLDDFDHSSIRVSEVLDPSYYMNILDKIKYRNVYIMCDMLKHDWEVNYLKEFHKYNPRYLIGGSEKYDFITLVNAPRIISSNSIFCWFAVLLGNSIESWVPDITIHLYQNLKCNSNMVSTKYYNLYPIDRKYHYECNRFSDINQHLPTLYEYAKRCHHITECGVRSVVSSYAFALGLRRKPLNKLVQVDLDYNQNVLFFKNEATSEGINVVFYKQSDLECPLEKTDLLFIDTWHIYGHLKRELSRWNKYVGNYIIMHDTTVDEWQGETIRCGWDAVKQSQETGIPVEEINKGLWPAIDEFLHDHPEWFLEKRFTHNNGLTILKRHNVFPIDFSIPECKIVDKVPDKTKNFAHIIPGDVSTYIFNEEKEYYQDYQQSIFGRTCKKGGWDCLRHYEILANGCIPWFDQLDKCPKKIMTHFPKEVVFQAMNEYEKDSDTFCQHEYKKYANILLEYTRNHLTTKSMAQYILDTVKTNAKSVLYISEKPEPDYLRCLTLHGFKELFGSNCHDYPCVQHLYTDYPNPKDIYGKGMTYTCLLDKTKYRDINADLTVENDIKNHKYDLIVYGSIHRGVPFWNLVHEYYSSNDIVLMCGEDSLACRHSEFTDYVFIREILY